MRNRSTNYLITVGRANPTLHSTAFGGRTYLLVGEERLASLVLAVSLTDGREQ